MSSRYVGPFEISERIGPVAYRLNSSKDLSAIYDTFHVSNLKKCLTDESLIISLEEVQINDKWYIIAKPIEILNREVKRLRRSNISIVKVHWNTRRGPEYTWEREDYMFHKYPHLFASKPVKASNT